MKLNSKHVKFGFLAVILITAGLGISISADHLQNEVLFDVNIQFSNEIDENFLDRIDAQVHNRLNSINIASVTIPAEMLELIENSPIVANWEYNIDVHLLEDTIDWGVDRVDAEVVWGGAEDAVDVTGTCGTSIKVAVIDTGVDMDHPDLAPNYAGGYDFVNDDSDPDDDHYHGTHVAGTIAAADDEPNALEGSLVGVSPCVELFAVKVLNDRGSGTAADVAAGIEWAADNGMHIASLSLGSSSPSDTIDAAGQYAYSNGVLLVAASGNDGGEVGYPAAFEEFIAVGATEKDDSIASFSNFGPELEMSAPGVDIMSTTPTDLSGGNPFQPSANYDTLSGTSMATPHVSAVAALAWSVNTSLTNLDIRQILQDSAEDLGAEGWDQYYGYGLADAEAAVSLAGDSGDSDDTTPPAKVSGLTATTVSDSQIDLSWDANSESDLDHYNVYRNGSLVAQVAAGSESYSDTGLSSGTTYTYEVSAVDTSGNEGEKSDPASATTDSGDGTTTSTMYVSDISFQEELEGGFPFGTYYTYATVTVVDGDGNPLEGVEVHVTVTYPDGSTASFSGTTNSDGQVTFKYESNECGTYHLAVDDLILDGYEWDTSQGLTEDTFTNC